jgi:glucosamine 6-phosphate synthetase-like amidotransferase/phosphosugar isomerase protein
MCAITGWSGKLRRGQWKQVHLVLHELFKASAVRGGDAAGFAAIESTEGGTRLVTDKRAVPSTLFAATSPAWRRLRRSSCVITHCRAATHGHPSRARNNHPFVGSHKSVAVVVNGVTPNYRNVAEDYGLELRSDCDSEIVLRLVEASQTPAAGLDLCLQELQGGLAAAVLDVQREIVWLAHNGARPLWVFRLNGFNGFFFASTEHIVLEALRSVFGSKSQSLLQILVPVVENNVTGISSQGQWIAPIDTAPPAPRMVYRGLNFTK